MYIIPTHIFHLFVLLIIVCPLIILGITAAIRAELSWITHHAEDTVQFGKHGPAQPSIFHHRELCLMLTLLFDDNLRSDIVVHQPP